MKLKDQGGVRLASWGAADIGLSCAGFHPEQVARNLAQVGKREGEHQPGGRLCFAPTLQPSNPPTNLLSSSAAGKPASASLCSRPAPNCTCDFLGLRQRWCQGFPLSGRQGSAKSTCPAPPAACPATQPSNPLTHPPVVRCAALHTHPVVSRLAAAWKMTAAVWLS